MKVLHITDHLPGYHKVWGGAEQVAYRYIKLLSGGDDEIIVGGVKPEKQIKEDFKFLRIRVIEDLFPGKLQVYVTGLKNRIFSFDPLAFFSLLLILQKEKPKVVHFHKFNKISFLAILAARLMGAKTVLGMYDYWYLCSGGMLIDGERNLCRKFQGSWCANCDAVTDFRFLLPVISSFRKPIFDFFLNKIDAYAVLSGSQRDLLAEYGIPKKKIFLVRQVFDLKNVKKGKDITGAGEVLYIGWIDPRKGPDIAINSILEVVKKIPSVKLNIVGEAFDKAYEQEIKCLVKDLKIEGRVIFWGKQPHEKIAAFYRKSKVVLLPEQWENMSPVVLVEAMAYGKPVVASNVGGLPEFIEDGKTGFLVTRDNPQSFARKTIFLLRNPVKAIKMGEAAREEIIKICDSGKISAGLKQMYGYLTKNEKN